MDGKEWNTAAVGPMKYQRASALIRRLRHPPVSKGGPPAG